MSAQKLINGTSYILSTLNIDTTRFFSGQQPEKSKSRETTISDNNTSPLLDKNQPIERLLIWFQRVVYWHEPLKTLITICSVLTSFLLFSLYEPRFYPCLIIGIFIYNLIIFWFQHVWPEIRVTPRIEDELNQWTDLHPHIKNIAELQQYVESFKQNSKENFNKLIDMRAQNPVKFCSICCVVFVITGSIGRLISGLNLILLLISIILTTPGLYLYVFPEVKKRSRFLNSFDIFAPFSSFNAQFMTKSTLRESHPLRKLPDTTGRLTSTMDPMTPIIEEDVVSTPLLPRQEVVNPLAVEVKNFGLQSSANLDNRTFEESKSQKQQQVRRLSIDKACDAQTKQQNSSSSSSSSQHCSEDGSLIDLEEDNHDFVIL